MNKVKAILSLLIFSLTIQGCVTSNYHTSHMSRTMNRFSIPKRKGMGRHFIHKGKRKFNPSYTKAAKYSSGN